MKKSKKEKSEISKLFSKYKNNPKELLRNLYHYLRVKVKNNNFFVAFIIVNIINTIILRSTTLGTSFIFDIDPVLLDVTLIMFFGSLGFLLNEKGRFKYLLVLTVVFSAICVVNSGYYNYYSSFSSVSELTRVKFISEVSDAVKENLLRPKDLIYVLAPIILFFLRRFYVKQSSFVSRNKKNGKKFKKALMLVGITFLMFAATLRPVDIGRLAKQWNREYIVKKFGIYGYHINDLVKSVRPKFASLFGYDKAMKNFKEFYEDYNEKPKNKYTNMFKDKNIIAIHAESIQNFVIGLKFNGNEVTPNLNRIIKESYYFNNFYSQVSMGTSSDTEFTFNTSLMPSNIGTVFVDFYDKEFVTIPKLLKEKGYYSFSMHGNKADYWNRRVMHKNLGYDKFIARDSYVIDEEIGLGLSDASFFRQSVPMIKKISEEKGKFYATIITLTNHTPFSEVDKYGEFAVDIKETVKDQNGVKKEVVYPYMEGTKLGNYLKSVHYADYALGLFFKDLEENGLLDNTVLVIYGDHDARLPKNDFVRFFNYDKETDGIKSEDDPTYFDFNNHEYELNRKVPLIIWSKETKKKPMVINHPMGMYNIMPTLGNMFGFYNEYALGKDIFTVGENNLVIFPNGDWINKDAYYNNNRGETYQLGKIVLSQEKIDLYNEKADSIMTVSNDILVYDLIKNIKIKEVDESGIVGEKDEK